MMTQPAQEVEAEVEELQEELDGIHNSAIEIIEGAASGGTLKSERVDWEKATPLLRDYEIWFNSALVFIEDYLPRRTADFEGSFADAASLMRFDDADYQKEKDYRGRLNRHIHTQRNLLASIPRKIETEQNRVRKAVSDQIATDEIYQAKELWDEGHVRAAGVVTGVALERHLLTLCEVSDSVTDFSHTDGINPLAQELYETGEIDETTRSQLEHLSSIRADCAHANEEEPNRRDVQRLFNQAEEIINTV